MLGDRALPGLEQRFKNLQPAFSQNFLGLVVGFLCGKVSNHPHA